MIYPLSSSPKQKNKLKSSFTNGFKPIKAAIPKAPGVGTIAKSPGANKIAKTKSSMPLDPLMPPTGY